MDSSSQPATTATETIKAAITRHLVYSIGKTPAAATLYDWRMAVSLTVRDRMVDAWYDATEKTYESGAKRVYYLSMEFLIGRLLEDGIVNLRLGDAVRGAVAGLGLDYDVLIADEPDAALGNGGLGRLAACYLESLSTLGCPAIGYGIRYENGLFRQGIVDGRQVERPETWLSQQHAWEFERREARYKIGFGGTVSRAGGAPVWTPAETVWACAYDTPIVGWKGAWVNTLRLWSARPVEPFDLGRFNRGEYTAAAEGEALARTISRVLYPDDSTDQGKELRLKQEYFFTAASVRDILRRFLSQSGDLRALPDKAAIQLNDTHPAIAGPELIRLLCDDHGLSFDTAFDIAARTLCYTNHTLLPEALERWPEALMARLLPRHLEIIRQIDARHALAHPGRKSTILEHGQVKMGEMSFITAKRVNGVSALHTGLMKSTVFSDLHRLHPDRIVNQTNGVTPRRWLLSSNPRLSALISGRIGDGWIDDLEQLQRLEGHIDDPAFLDAFARIKRDNKADLARFIAGNHGLAVDPAMMFDIQIKRIHEYKRQHLNILETIALWQAMRDDPGVGWTPRLKIFAGKAAPAYHFAKDIIHLINAVAGVINSDPATSHMLKVAFLPNYNVSLAEKLIPAADLSEQISTAGKEASGTGNMKFALNGAMTIGTLDGANVEILERVGAENFFLFGMTAEEVEARRAVPGHAAEAIAADSRLAAALDTLRDGTFTPDAPGLFRGIADNVAGPDYFLVASDFTDYWRAQRDVDAAFRDRAGWTRRTTLNTARSGWFSSDRAIRGYIADVWQAETLL